MGIFATKHWDPNGKEIEHADWQRIIQSGAGLRVSGFRPSDGALVVTAWVGLDLRVVAVDGSGPPLVYETTVADEGARRYATEAEAVAGHAEVMALGG